MLAERIDLGKVCSKKIGLKELSPLFNPKPLKNIINNYKTMPV